MSPRFVKGLAPRALHCAAAEPEVSVRIKRVLKPVVISGSQISFSEPCAENYAFHHSEERKLRSSVGRLQILQSAATDWISLQIWLSF